MVGNDIVDIELAKRQSDWQRPRYLDKIFNLQEQQLIYASNEPTIMVWKLWSMKEAAYKLYTQVCPSRFYNPKAFTCNLKNGETVRYKSFLCETNTKTTIHYILSEARLKNKLTTSKVINLENISHMNQGKTFEKEALKLFATERKYLEKNLKYAKTPFGVPLIYYKSKKYNISISHHGKFGAIAIA
ncbi:4'-phosphopantetheinyl transferase family protein [Winogradskyella alexanderae]|uniref:4'-phosphopantetheinyl transferase superfamily protein n=1 Tax=Winogradskyella alexanderae TaxID=2877123 RepID=A0ABS7XNY9_9FLAO|nr:4'-phosphopantetheinyl transferase superfamily protein [Winogradskyella alexanderae]MCA0131219.1 4'-phosphopantetheinyl transferase superfamily protein [Winogradskyella alexanderae]